MIKKFNFKNTKVFYFSRWSRKNYAVLLSIGKVVHIGSITVKIADLSLNKLKKKISILLEKPISYLIEVIDNIDYKIFTKDLLTQVRPITIKSKTEKELITKK